MRALLIEDEPTTAKSIELMLGSEGFNVYTTDLGEEGLDLAKLYDYDIILLDLNLPDMHGYDVHVRQVQVEKDDVVIVELGEIEAFFAEIRRVDVEAFGPEHQLDALRGRR